MPTIISLLRELESISAEGPGVSRPALSDRDIEARHWLAHKMRDTGLDARLDAVGNVYGKDPTARHTVLLGSHADSVPHGGWLDGPLGVAYAMEAARLWRQAEPDSNVGIDVLAFSDEEGRYLPCLGSKAFCGEVPEDLLQALAFEGQTFAQRAAACGLPSVLDGLATLDLTRHRAYVEAHIEQGPVLDANGEDLGIVTGIVGIKRYTLSFQGQADHAGTTPMHMRKDAGMLAARFMVACHDVFEQYKSQDSVWNFGRLQLWPGVANVVPKRADLTIEIRDLSSDVLATLDQRLRALVAETSKAGPVTLELVETANLVPALMDAQLQRSLEAEIQAGGASYRYMPSGAIHDAMVFASRIPTAMLFVPSINGRSHTPVEDTLEEHLLLGFEVFKNTVFRILRELEKQDI